MLRYLLPATFAAALLSTQALAAAFPNPPLYPSFNTPRAKANFQTFGIEHSSEVEPRNINNAGEVAGQFVEPSEPSRSDGFIRKPGGKIITFKAPGALTTSVAGVNNNGVVAGTDFQGAGSNGNLGFFRAADGTMTTFKIPAAGAIFDLNDEGDVVGEYQTGKQELLRTFVRTAGGTIAKFHIGDFGTTPTFIANDGTVLGTYGFNSSGGQRGFIREPDGTIVKLNLGKTYTYPLGVNSSGVIAGWYSDDGLAHFGFERMPDGTIIKMSLPNGSQFNINAINDAGTVTGTEVDTGGAKDFIRTSDGKITSFLPPGETYGSKTVAINSSGAVLGYCSKHLGIRGFVRVPAN